MVLWLRDSFCGGSLFLVLLVGLLSLLWLVVVFRWLVLGVVVLLGSVLGWLFGWRGVVVDG